MKFGHAPEHAPEHGFAWLNHFLSVKPESSSHSKFEDSRWWNSLELYGFLTEHEQLMLLCLMLHSFCQIHFHCKLLTETTTKSDTNLINTDYSWTEGHTIPLSARFLLIACQINSNNLTPLKRCSMWRLDFDRMFFPLYLYILEGHDIFLSFWITGFHTYNCYSVHENTHFYTFRFEK